MKKSKAPSSQQNTSTSEEVFTINFEENSEKEQETREKISSLIELREITLECFRKATKKIQIYSDNLDPRILSNRNIEAVLTQFIRTSRNVRIEILIKAEKNLQGIDHRIVQLAQKYTSFVAIKVIPKDYQENYFGFYVIDGSTMLYRTNCERFETELLRMPNSKLKQQAKYFNEVWQLAAPASHLRALII